MALGTGVYGTNASDAVSYGIASVAAGGSITNLKFSDLVTKISAERQRRNKTSFSLSLNNPISAADFNSMLTNLNVKGHDVSQAYNTSGTVNITTYPQISEPAGIPANVTASSSITATVINDLITAINNAGAVCSCNCNYCTCNCNYCTCNCNYACTCNCNYSDKRLKENITLIGTTDDLNVYSYTYLWNKAKTYIGVLAQEVLTTKYASAVMTDANGFYYVDYSKLPVEFKEA